MGLFENWDMPIISDKVTDTYEYMGSSGAYSHPYWYRYCWLPAFQLLLLWLYVQGSGVRLGRAVPTLPSSWCMNLLFSSDGTPVHTLHKAYYIRFDPI